MRNAPYLRRNCELLFTIEGLNRASTGWGNFQVGASTRSLRACYQATCRRFCSFQAHHSEGEGGPACLQTARARPHFRSVIVRWIGSKLEPFRIVRCHQRCQADAHTGGTASARSMLEYIMFVPSAVCGILALWQVDRLRSKVRLFPVLQAACLAAPGALGSATLRLVCGLARVAWRRMSNFRTRLRLWCS